jgi:CBS domain-containing protein
MRVREVMASDVTVVAPSTTIDAAAQIMADLDVDALPVGETEAAPAGIITSRDILLRVVAPRRDPRTTRVAEAMSADVFCCAAEDDTADVLREMERRQVRRMPVLDGDGRIVGLVTRDALEQAEPRMAGPRQG